MFNANRKVQHSIYRDAHKYFLNHPKKLIELEEFFSDFLIFFLKSHLKETIMDYNEASYLYPFWQNYPPDKRGRQPVGDQFPWIEVGEHAIGRKLSRFISQEFRRIRDTGLPTGADERFVITDERIGKITGLTDSAWLFVDIKSVGPRDDFDHTVMSHNQVSGDGIWVKENKGIVNSVLKARGRRVTHDFHCSLPPLYVLSDKTIAPVVLMVIKPRYNMLTLDTRGRDRGQPLSKLTVVSIPNGILLTKNPGYLIKYPNLLFPGKDDKEKNPLKIRARISFKILSKIDNWRVRTISVPSK